MNKHTAICQKLLIVIYIYIYHNSQKQQIVGNNLNIQPLIVSQVSATDQQHYTIKSKHTNNQIPYLHLLLQQFNNKLLQQQTIVTIKYQNLNNSQNRTQPNHSFLIQNLCQNYRTISSISYQFLLTLTTIAFPQKLHLKLLLFQKMFILLIHYHYLFIKPKQCFLILSKKITYTPKIKTILFQFLNDIFEISLQQVEQSFHLCNNYIPPFLYHYFPKIYILLFLISILKNILTLYFSFIIISISLHMQDIVPPTSTMIVAQVSRKNQTQTIDSEPEEQLNSNQSNGPTLIIDNTSSKSTVSLFASFLALIISSFIVCGFLPTAYQVIKKSESRCQNPTQILSNRSIDCTDFDIKNNPKRGMLVKGLNQENQYLITNTNFFLIDPEVETTVKGDVKLGQYKINENNGDDDKVENEIVSTEAPYEVNSTNKINKLYDNQEAPLGLRHRLFYQHTIVSKNILFIIDFKNLSSQPNIKNVTLEILFINSSFTQFSIALRIVFFVISLISCIIYALRYRNINKSIKVLEHKLILLLSVLLVFFNNPLIILCFKGQQNFLVFFTQLTSILLPVFLVFFWICAFQRGDTENTLHSSKVLRHPFKWVLLVILLAFELSIYLFKAYHHLLDYVGNPYEDPKPLVVLDYLAFAIAVICLIFILLRCVNIFRHTETMSRYRVLVVISSFFIVYMAIFLFSQSFYIFSIQPKSIFLVVVFLNVYVFYLQVLYQPISLIEVSSTNPKQTASSSIPSSYFNEQPLKINVQYPPFNIPKLSTIVQRSVQQSVVRNNDDENKQSNVRNREDQDLDNFQIGQPTSNSKKASYVNIEKIYQIQQQNEEQEVPSEDVNSDRNIDSSLIKSNRGSHDGYQLS